MDTIKQIINKFRLTTKKSLGQNYILDQNITNKVTNLIEIKNQIVLEIGPGPGCLTRSLIDKGAKKVALLTTVDYVSVGKLRTTGYLECLESNDLPIDESLILKIEDMDHYAEKIEEFLKQIFEHFQAVAFLVNRRCLPCPSEVVRILQPSGKLSTPIFNLFYRASVSTYASDQTPTKTFRT